MTLFDKACQEYGNALGASVFDEKLARALGSAADALIRLIGTVDAGRDVALQSLHRKLLLKTQNIHTNSDVKHPEKEST